MIESSVSIAPFAEGSLNKEILDEHEQYIKMQDDMLEKKLAAMGGQPEMPGMSQPISSMFLPQAGMISMLDDDEDSLIQVKEHAETEQQTVLWVDMENGHIKMVNVSEPVNKKLFNYTIISLDPHANVHTALKHKVFKAANLKEME